jgi:hypothetical protein
MDDMPDWDAATETRYEESQGSLIGSGESLLPAYHTVVKEIEFLKDLEQRNLSYPFRSPEADAELEEIRRELAGWQVLAEA